MQTDVEAKIAHSLQNVEERIETGPLSGPVSADPHPSLPDPEGLYPQTSATPPEPLQEQNVEPFVDPIVAPKIANAYPKVKLKTYERKGNAP